MSVASFFRCAKDGCQRVIFISWVTGSESTAKSDPQVYSQGYKQCTDFENCGACHCDRHWGGKCVKCGSSLTPVRWGPKTREEVEWFHDQEERFARTAEAREVEGPSSTLRETPSRAQMDESPLASRMRPSTSEPVTTRIDEFVRQAKTGPAQDCIEIRQLEALVESLIRFSCHDDPMLVSGAHDAVFEALSGECPLCSMKYPGELLSIIFSMQMSPKWTTEQLEKQEGAKVVIPLIQHVAEGHCINLDCSSRELEIHWRGQGT